MPRFKKLLKVKKLIGLKNKGNFMQKSNFEKVKDFMDVFGQEVKTKAEFPDINTSTLRLKLINEEYKELVESMEQQDLIGVADALTDLLYVVYGAGLAFGINLDECFDEVHRSNMSKLDSNGNPIYREDGKVMKSPNYFEPNLEKIIRNERQS